MVSCLIWAAIRLGRRFTALVTATMFSLAGTCEDWPVFSGRNPASLSTNLTLETIGLACSDATLMFAKMELNPEGVKGMTMDSLSNYDIDVMRDWVRK